jgi:hypothetical protein
MNRPRFFKTLRIAWSVAWGLAAVLLCVLWARSYWHADAIEINQGHDLTLIESLQGQITFYDGRWLDYYPPVKNLFYWKTKRVSEAKPTWGRGFMWISGPHDEFSLPHWCPGLISAALAALPWRRWPDRFSLRTLLIAITMVSVVLGLMVWSLK